MNDAERADWLARAIDSLLDAAGQETPPNTLDDEELTSLLRIANLRSKAGNEKRLTSADHQAAVWQNLSQRLEAARNDLPAMDDHAEEVVEAIASRRPLYEDESEGPQAQPEVWERVRQRLEPSVPPPKQGPAFEGPLFASGDAQLDSLVRAALTRPLSGKPRDSHVQEQLWARMRGDPRRATIDDLWPGQEEPSLFGRMTSRIVAMAAAVVLTVAALGPLPVTGFADHPAVSATRSIGQRVGLVTDAPSPPVTAGNVSILGMEVTTEEAQSLLALPAVEPAGLPEGFELVSSRFYPAATTSTDGGVYATVYSTSVGTAAFNIYQAAASNTDLVGRGSPVYAQVSRTPATYFEGGWVSSDGEITWDTSDAQTLVFQRDGLRTTIHYSGPPIAPQALLNVANAMAIQHH